MVLQRSGRLCAAARVRGVQRLVHAPVRFRAQVPGGVGETRGPTRGPGQNAHRPVDGRKVRRRVRSQRVFGVQRLHVAVAIAKRSRTRRRVRFPRR